MKNNALCAGVSFLFLSCAGPALIRNGYPRPESPGEPCEIAIVKHKEYSGDKRPVGSLRIEGNGFSTKCGEKHVLEIIKREGCSIGATVAHLKNIIEPSM